MSEQVIVYVRSGYHCIYSYADAANTLAECIERSEAWYNECVEIWIQNGWTASAETFDAHYAERTGKPYAKDWQTMEIMSLNDFYAIERAELLTPATEITKERYWELLECLPPMNWNGSRFFMSEFYTGSYTNMCFKLGDKYYEQMVDYSDKSTWVYKV